MRRPISLDEHRDDGIAADLRADDRKRVVSDAMDAAQAEATKARSSAASDVAAVTTW